MKQSPLVTIGVRSWSYQTAIRDQLPDGRTIGNATKYSHTTSIHQRMVGVYDCDVILLGVPKDTEDLVAYFNRSR